jgi:protein involved in polysaccharide export with SLBB domain
MKYAVPYLLLFLPILSSCDKSNNDAQNAQSAESSTAKAPENGATSLALSINFPPTTQPGRIVVGDLIEIELPDLGAPGKSLVVPKQVGTDGTISLPYSSKPLPVNSKTNGEIERAITAEYEAQGVSRQAQAHVRRLRVAGTGGATPGLIAPYDLLRIGISELTGPSSTTILIGRVGGDGTVNVPFTGPQKIGGMTDQQAEKAIAAGYRNAHVIQNAIVTVLRLEAAPAGAEKIALPDVAIYPVPEHLRWIYEPRVPN